MKNPREPDYPVIVYLREPKAHFVSLVQRGANKTPFRIAKQELDHMRIIHRIIAKKGTDLDRIRSAVGPDASQLLKLDSPEESGAFTIYEQHEATAFKSDSLELVSLSDDNSIVCLCGELAKKSDGFISKLLDRQPTAGIEIPDGVTSSKSIQADFGSLIYDELESLKASLCDLIGRVDPEKMATARKCCDSFLKTLKTVSTAADSFPKPVAVKAEATSNDDKPRTSETDMNLNLDEKLDATQKCEDKQPVDQPAVKSEDKQQPVEQKQPDAVTAALEGFGKIIEAMKSEIDALKKAPAQAVRSLEDSGKPVDAKKSENVFAGAFGNLSRFQRR